VCAASAGPSISTSHYNTAMRRIAAVLLLAASVASAAPKKSAPKVVAPEQFPHPVALFLASLSSDGKRNVVYKAQAIGTHFFFEEPSGVTVYAFDGTQYVKAEFLKGSTLSRAVKKYAKR